MQRVRTLITVVVAAGLGAALATMALPVAGQTAAYRAPRLADGHPDLNGIWQALNEANYDIELHAARPAMALRAGPLRAAARRAGPGARRRRRRAARSRRGRRRRFRTGRRRSHRRKKNQENWLTLDPEIKCYLPGVPRATYMPHPFQILHSTKAIFIAYQYAGAVRDVYLKDPGPAPVDSWMGQSVGRWEGDTLVVDVTGFNDQTWFDRSGNFHSDALHVVERYTRTAPDVISVRGDHRGSEGVHAAVEDEHAACTAGWNGMRS